MITIGIDPGFSGTGIAYFDGEKYETATVYPDSKTKDFDIKSNDIISKLILILNTWEEDGKIEQENSMVFIERPPFYIRQRRGRNLNTKSIIMNSLLSGYIAGVLSCRCKVLMFVEAPRTWNPRNWKSLTKHRAKAYLERRLGRLEKMSSHEIDALFLAVFNWDNLQGSNPSQPSK